MTRKKALYDTIFVGLMAFAFSSFVLWQLFERIGPTGNDFEPLASILQFTPFVLSGAIGLVIFNMVRQVLMSRVDQNNAQTPNDNC